MVETGTEGCTVDIPTWNTFPDLLRTWEGKNHILTYRHLFQHPIEWICGKMSFLSLLPSHLFLFFFYANLFYAKYSSCLISLEISLWNLYTAIIPTEASHNNKITIQTCNFTQCRGCLHILFKANPNFISQSHLDTIDLDLMEAKDCSQNISPDQMPLILTL